MSIALSVPVGETTLLLVDDEPEVLHALGRLLRNEPYRLLFAADADQALALCADNVVDLVMTDYRLQGQDGVELLGRIQQSHPDCLRLLLTGQADMQATIRAINDGHVYRFIAKPWNNEELRQVLKQALSHQQSEREQQRLKVVTQQQNQALEALNASLEERVEARTQELRQSAAMLDAAYSELQQSYVTATQVFSTLLNLRLPKRLQSNGQVGDLLEGFASRYGLDAELARDLAMAAALYNLGKLCWDDRLLDTPSEQLYGADLDIYRNYPVVGESLLMSLEHLAPTAHIIGHHHERWNGSGFPNHLKEEAIPYGARLLGIAVDFIELQRGMLLKRKVPRDDALMLLEKLAGRVYDPVLCRDFITLCREDAPDLGVKDPDIQALATRQVEEGMVLAEDLYTQSGVLLLNAGKVLEQTLIDKLIRFEELEHTRYTLLVRPPEEPSDDE
ncbi:response regulator [Halomonas sp. CH40]